MIAVFILVIQTILFLGHLFVYKTFVRFFGISSPTHLWWARVVFALLSISFVLASLVAYRFYGPIARGFYYSAAVWLGTLYWLFWASILAWAALLVSKVVIPGKNVAFVGVVLLVAALAVSVYGVWNSYQTKVRHYTVKIENLPEQWKGRKAVLVADTHLGHVRNAGFAKKVSALIQAQSPDIVFIPGDFYDGPPTDYKKAALPFGRITAPLGVFFAPGNHEEYGDSSNMFQGLQEAGVHVLRNQMQIVDGLQVIGVDYHSTTTGEGEQQVLDTLHINPTVPSILIKHVPSHIDVAERAGVSFQVSGHTHLGQVYPLVYVTKRIFGQFYYGLKKFNATQVLTTSGAGTWGPPQRVGTSSEIAVITFE